MDDSIGGSTYSGIVKFEDAGLTRNKKMQISQEQDRSFNQIFCKYFPVVLYSVWFIFSK